jgi:hypothetical protein
MARRRRKTVRPLPTRPRPTDLDHAPETDAVRLPPKEEPYRGEWQNRIAEREPGALKKPSADAVGEGNVTELAQDFDDESVRKLEQNAQKTEPRAAHHPHRPRRS